MQPLQLNIRYKLVEVSEGFQELSYQPQEEIAPWKIPLFNSATPSSTPSSSFLETDQEFTPLEFIEELNVGVAKLYHYKVLVDGQEKYCLFTEHDILEKTTT